MFRFTVFVTVCACALAAVNAYGVVPAPAAYAPAPAPAAYSASAYSPAAYSPAPAPKYAAPPKVLKQVIIPDIAILPDEASAKAQAQSQRVGAQATAHQLAANIFDQLDVYAKQIGQPLLVKNYGPLTNLYAAALPSRSFVGQIDPVFLKGPYGYQHLSETSYGEAAI